MTIEQFLQLAKQHHQAGDLRAAEPLYRQILQRQPAHAEAMHLLGMIALQCGHPEPAIGMMERSLALAPENGHWHNNLAEAYKGARRFADAARHYRKFLELSPDHPDGMHSLAIALEKSGHIDEAVAQLRRTIEMHPEFARPYMSLGALFEQAARYDEAMSLYNRAIMLEPDYAKARAARAGLLLRQGDFEQGWEEYEWRWKVRGFPGRPPTPGVPVWDGSPAPGKTLLVLAEQGLGDSIMFMRYLPLIRGLGLEVRVECPPPVASMIAPLAEVSDRTTPHDLQIPMMSLPRALKTIPATVPYAVVPADRVERWQGRIEGDGKPCVGLCWLGGQSQPHRSLPLQAMEPLLRSMPGARFYSLVKDPRADEPAQMREWGIVNLMPEVRDFADTAAIISRMDRIITIDTAIAHIAGALARPTDLMLARHADWRWMQDRGDSPWYPTMRLFRQPEAGNWDAVLRAVSG